MEQADPAPVAEVDLADLGLVDLVVKDVDLGLADLAVKDVDLELADLAEKVVDLELAGLVLLVDLGQAVVVLAVD